VDFTREPIIETIITPREGYRLAVRSSKNMGQEEHFVDAVEVVSFGSAFFFRSLERPKPFVVPVGDYEILEVREPRMVLKTQVHEGSVKIAGGRDQSSRHGREDVRAQEAKTRDEARREDAKREEARREEARREEARREESRREEARREESRRDASREMPREASSLSTQCEKEEQQGRQGQEPRGRRDRRRGFRRRGRERGDADTAEAGVESIPFENVPGEGLAQEGALQAKAASEYVASQVAEGQEEIGAFEAQKNQMRDQSKEAPKQASAGEQMTSATLFRAVLPPPTTLIRDDLQRLRESEVYRGAFFIREEGANDQDDDDSSLESIESDIEFQAKAAGEKKREVSLEEEPFLITPAIEAPSQASIPELNEVKDPS
jgi:hypothetical protein